jgi:cytochrome c
MCRAAVWVLAFALFAAIGDTARAQAGFDEGKAEDTLERNKCLKCHSIDKKKEGPPYKEVAKKYRGKPDAEKKIQKHLTTAPMVEIDGVEEEHKVIKVKNEAELFNLIRWILAR